MKYNYACTSSSTLLILPWTLAIAALRVSMEACTLSVRGYDKREGRHTRNSTSMIHVCVLYVHVLARDAYLDLLQLPLDELELPGVLSKALLLLVEEGETTMKHTVHTTCTYLAGFHTGFPPLPPEFTKLAILLILSSLLVANFQPSGASETTRNNLRTSKFQTPLDTTCKKNL